MSKIIILSGYIGSGKDTAADYLESHHNYHKFAFADHLKDVCSHLYGIPRKNFDDRVLKDSIIPTYNKSPRDFCIKIATDSRKQNPEVYAKYVGDKIESLNIDKAVISDARFPNEIEHIKNRFPHTITIWINRKPKSKKQSEGFVDNITYDYTIDNTTDSLDNLYAQLDDCVFKQLDGCVQLNNFINLSI